MMITHSGTGNLRNETGRTFQLEHQYVMLGLWTDHRDLEAVRQGCSATSAWKLNCPHLHDRLYSARAKKWEPSGSTVHPVCGVTIVTMAV